MNKYIVRSFEHQYEGRYGIESYLVVEDELKEVEEIARDESYAIMDSCVDIKEYFEDMTNELFSEGHFDISYQDIFNSLYESNVAYNIYVIREDCPLTEQQINTAAYYNPEELIEKYCDLIISC